jgi:hypothetical protein
MRHLPYTTKSGLQIGCRYEPPPVNHVSHEGEFWQGVFLGYRRTPTAQQVIGFAMYLVVLLAVFLIAALIAR